MKHILNLFLFSFLLISCGSDDSPNSNPNQSLVGQWKIEQRIIEGNVNALEECEPFSVYTYNENETYSELHYAADANTECLDNASIEFFGTWQKNSDTSYTFINSNNEASEVLIEFESSNAFEKTFNSLTNPNDPLLQTIVEKYIRISQ